MTDAQIRKLLARQKPALFLGNKPGTVAILQTHLAEAGADLDEVLAWVEAHGGELDRTLPVTATRRGVTSIPKPVGKKFYIVPEKALAG